MAGSDIRRACSATGRSASASYVGRPRKMCDGAQAAQQPLTVRADLRHDARAVCVLALEPGELVAPRAVAAAAERERDHEARLA